MADGMSDGKIDSKKDDKKDPAKEAEKRKKKSKSWGTRTVDAYEIWEQVGEGTYGQVYKGMHKITKQIVALKKIRPHNTGGLPITAVREIKILKTYSHRNLVDLVEIVTSKGSRDTEGHDDDFEDDDEPPQGVGPRAVGDGRGSRPSWAGRRRLGRCISCLSTWSTT